MILSTGGSCLAASGFWSCFGFFPSIWPVSTSASPLVQKTLLLSTLKIYFSLYKVGEVGEKQPFSVPTLSPLSSGNKVLRPLTKLRLWYTFRNPAKIRASESDHDSNADESCPWVSDPQEVRFPFYSDRLSNCFRVSDFIDFLGFPGGSAVINLLAEQEIWVPSLIWEDPLEKEMATNFSILAWEIHGQRSLAGYSPWVHKESDTT